jgi:hypothetical protein
MLPVRLLGASSPPLLAFDVSPSSGVATSPRRVVALLRFLLRVPVDSHRVLHVSLTLPASSCWLFYQVLRLPSPSRGLSVAVPPVPVVILSSPPPLFRRLPFGVALSLARASHRAVLLLRWRFEIVPIEVCVADSFSSLSHSASRRSVFPVAIVPGREFFSPRVESRAAFFGSHAPAA